MCARGTECVHGCLWTKAIHYQLQHLQPSLCMSSLYFSFVLAAVYRWSRLGISATSVHLVLKAREMLPRGLISAWGVGLSSPCFLLPATQLLHTSLSRSRSPHHAASHSHFPSYFFVSRIFSLTCSRSLFFFPPPFALSHISLFSHTSGWPVVFFCLFFFFLSPVLLLLTIHSGSTLQWLHWCSRTSTYSCPLSFRPIIFMAWESMCIRTIALTQTGGPGPSSPGMLSLTGWGVQGHTAVCLRNTHAHVHSVTASMSIPVTFFFGFGYWCTKTYCVLKGLQLTCLARVCLCLRVRLSSMFACTPNMCILFPKGLIIERLVSWLGGGVPPPPPPPPHFNNSPTSPPAPSHLSPLYVSIHPLTSAVSFLPAGNPQPLRALPLLPLSGRWERKVVRGLPHEQQRYG